MHSSLVSLGVRRDTSGRSVNKALGISSVQHLDTIPTVLHDHPLSSPIINMVPEPTTSSIPHLRKICALNAGCPRTPHTAEHEVSTSSTPLTLAGIWDDGNRANKLAGVVCTCGGPVLLQTLFKDLVLNNCEVQRVGDRA